MASQSREYENKKFKISEMSNTLKKVVESFNIDTNTVSFTYYFVTDGIKDKKELTFNEVEMITQFDEDEILQFFSLGRYSILLGLTYNNDFYINISTPTAEELKRTFSIFETELNLKETSEQDNNNKTETSFINEEKKSGIKRVQTTYTKNFGPIQIFKEDIISIISIFKEYYDYCKIELDEFSIKDKSEIEHVKDKLNKDTVKNLTINGSDSKYGSNINLRLSEYNASITVYDDNDIKSIGVLHKIELILSKKENRILKLMNSKKSLAFVVIISIGVIVPIRLFGYNLIGKYISNILSLFLIILPLVFVFIGIGLSYKKHSLIYLFNSNENPHILTKYRDIIVTIVGGLIVILIASALGIGS